MIQELLGGAGFISGERKFSINGVGLGGGGGVLEAATVVPPSLSPSPSPSSSSSSTTSTTTATTSTAPTTSNSNSTNSENLRCPRCDSSNTKFCYYNNYNLTQPRHFCKTCRRYWTKGGALRNVPIGGGCRKNKSPTVSSSSATVGKATSGSGAGAAGKMKMVVASEMIGRSGFGGGFDHHELGSSPILWGSPQNSHLLALLRSSTTHQNPNPNPNPLAHVKEEGTGTGIIGCTTTNTTDAAAVLGVNGTVNNGRAQQGLDPLGQAPSLGLCSSFWRSISNQNQPPQYQQNGFGTTTLGEAHNSTGVQELYQRLRSSSGNYYNDHSPHLFFTHLGSSSSSSSSTSTGTLSILESAPVGAGGELGFWNNPPPFSWSDLPTTTNGTAYP